MNNLMERKIFVKNDSNKRERENFRNFIFDNLEIDNDMQFSFYRSDFRGAHFNNCTLTNILFDMADFIDTTFLNLKFSKIEWGLSEIKNCYFDNVHFSNNTYSSSIQKSIFHNCHFINESFKAIAHNVTFVDCSFTNCDFESATFEDIKFINTNFNNCELSTMHAENFSFEYCRLTNVVWGIEYWFTYLIYRSEFDDIKLKYRGEYVDMNKDKDLFAGILLDLKKSKNYVEYLNIMILMQIFSGINTISIFNHNIEYNNAFYDLLQSDNEMHRNKQMVGMFKLMQFYFFRDNFSLYDTMYILELVNSLDLSKLQSSEALQYRAEIYKMNEVFTTVPFEYKQIVELPYEYKISATIGLDFERQEDAEAFLNKIFLKLTRQLQIDDDMPYIIIDTKKGSWQFQIISSAILITMLLKIIKSSVDYYINTKLRLKIASYVLDGLEDSKQIEKQQIDKIQKTVHLLQSTGMLSSEDFNPKIFSTDDLLKFISVIINLKNFKDLFK